MKLFDLYNNISSSVKESAICVEGKEVEYSGWYQSRKLDYTWSSEGKYTWKNYGSLWDLPIQPSVTWEEETPSLYESLDRINAILATFGIGTSTDFQIANFQNKKFFNGWCLNFIFYFYVLGFWYSILFRISHFEIRIYDDEYSYLLF